MFNIFKITGYVPHFLTYIFGTTGSMKTAVSKVLYNMWNGSNSKIASTFADTITAIEIKMASISDEVFLIDDWHPANSRAEELSMKEKLGQLIRYFGDGISKDRATPSLDLKDELAHHGLAVITGEETNGSESSLLRCILIPVDRSSFDGEKLSEYQENPLLLATGKYYFIKFIEQNFDEIVRYIKLEFPELRDKYVSYFQEGRLADDCAYLEITANILLNYGLQIQAIAKSDVLQIIENWKQIIIESVGRSERESKEISPAVMYLLAIQSFINNNSVSFAKTKNAYCENISAYCGFFDYEAGVLFLQHDTIYRKITEYWGEIKKRFPLSHRQVHKELAITQVLRTQGQGSLNGEYLYRVTINNQRPKMLAIDLKIMGALLDN